MKIHRTFDKSLINSILTQPDILPQFFEVRGDPERHPNVYFLKAKSGLFVCTKTGDEMNCHAAIPAENRGLQAYKDVKAAIKWVWANTDCERITTRADKTKKHLLHFNGKLLNRINEDETYIHYEVNR